MHVEHQKCNFPSAADDRLQRDIFVIGINDSFQRSCGDIISHEDLTSLTFTQVISKARDFEASIQTDSAITQQHLEEAANKVTPIRNKPKWQIIIIRAHYFAHKLDVVGFVRYQA